MRSPNLLQRAIEFNQIDGISAELRERLFLRAFGGVAVLIVLGLLLSGGLLGAGLAGQIANIACMVLLIVVWALYALRRTYAALFLMVWGVWLLVTALILSESGSTSIWMLPQFLIVIFARFVLTGRVAILLGVLTALVDISIYQFQLYRFLPNQLTDMALQNEELAIASSLFFVLLIFHLTDIVLRETLRQNQLNEGRYRSLFDNITDAVLLIDKDYRFLEVNQQAEELLGTSKDRLAGRSLFEVTTQEEAKILRGNFDRLESEGSLAPFERPLARADGSRRVVETTLNMVTDEKGAPRFYQAVIRDITERKQLEDDLRLSLGEMESLAMQDALTGLLNRRAIMEHAEAEWHRSRREHRPMCIMLVDLDNFKNVNDTVGHLEGDKVIHQAAQVIQSSLRRYDWAGRWGGDEFLLILPGTSLSDARLVAERLRNEYVTLEERKRVVMHLQPYLSIGISVFSGRAGDDTSLNELFAQADKALYLAKHQGKNRVEIFRQADESLI